MHKTPDSAAARGMVDPFLSHIPPAKRDEPCVIFDVGSRDGAQSVEFYHAFPHARIYAFECNPNTLDLCRANIAPFADRITLIEGAVCDYDGRIAFYPIDPERTITTWADGNPGASSLFRSNGQYTVETYVQNETEVPCHRLDTVMRDHGIERVDLVWMDIQGAELLALQGMGAHLDGVDYLHVEVSHRAIYDGQVLFDQLDAFLRRRRFQPISAVSRRGWQEDVVYKRRADASAKFDVVIPVGPRDLEILQRQLALTKQNVIDHGRIFLVCADGTATNAVLGATDSSEPSAEVIVLDERDVPFPFSIETVVAAHGERQRNGWYFQQLVKLYAGSCIPGLSERYLVIDADTLFLRPTTFICPTTDRCQYCIGSEFHPPYFRHLTRMHESLAKVVGASGICHHMMFETRFLRELMALVESAHAAPFYQVFLDQVDAAERDASGASEYELYLNFVMRVHGEEVVLRPLQWANVPRLSPETMANCDFVALHWYNRNKPN